MFNDYPPTWLYSVLSGLSCLLFLVGLLAGIIAIVRKRTLPGILAIAAFLLLGLDSIVRLIDLSAGNSIMDSIGGKPFWILFCLQAPLTLFGYLALVIAIFTFITNKARRSIQEELPPQQ